MPTENERKYVLRKPLNSDHLFDELSAGSDWHCIDQGYLAKSKDLSVRIRAKVKADEQDEDIFDRTMTVKKQLKNRLVEVETEISKEDFLDLWQICSPRLNKLRICRDGWEIDFFRTKTNQTYFIQAEYEMPEGQEEPEHIPDFISDNLLFIVPRNDKRFSSKKLADIGYAQKLWNSLHVKELQAG